MISVEKIRAKSLALASELGYIAPTNLPFLERRIGLAHTSDEALDRLFAIYVVAAAAYGFDRRNAKSWLERNGNTSALTIAERRFLDAGEGEASPFKFQIEGLWALFWSCRFVGEEFSFASDCPDDLVTRLPDLRAGDEQARVFRERAKLRDVGEVMQMTDLAYCIQWAIRDATLRQRKLGVVREYVVRERRRALEWLLIEEDWEHITLDT